MSKSSSHIQKNKNIDITFDNRDLIFLGNIKLKNHQKTPKKLIKCDVNHTNIHIITM